VLFFVCVCGGAGCVCCARVVSVSLEWCVFCWGGRGAGGVGCVGGGWVVGGRGGHGCLGSSSLLDEIGITVHFVLQTQYFICDKIQSACMVIVHIPISVDQECKIY